MCSLPEVSSVLTAGLNERISAMIEKNAQIDFLAALPAIGSPSGLLSNLMLRFILVRRPIAPPVSFIPSTAQIAGEAESHH